ncbi:MAG: class I SAM-dependent methyltransferase [candidate division WOR-3 bacterium]|nr:class I SAM-dependent methyltransferase [candidate division WOR-3 bacterium]
MNSLTKSFSKIAGYYDDLMKDVDYEGWIHYILDIADLYDVQMSSLLDVTCGTGNSTIPFVETGLSSIIGADGSFEMLEVAKRKRSDLFFVQANARNLPFAGHFNLVISIFDSLNYILDYNDLLAAFDSIKESLLPGGHFIFDLNTPYGLKTVLERDVRKDNTNLISVWRNAYDEKERILTLHLTLYIKKDNGWSRVDEIHRERGYTEDKIREGLESSGFSIQGTFKCFEHSRVDRFTKRILYIAKS